VVYLMANAEQLLAEWRAKAIWLAWEEIAQDEDDARELRAEAAEAKGTDR